MAWIIKAAQCYLGSKDKLVDTPEEAYEYHYKREAKDHATTWCIFHQWADGSPIRTSVEPAPKKKAS
jgi:hypothetical protein